MLGVPVKTFLMPQIKIITILHTKKGAVLIFINSPVIGFKGTCRPSLK